MRRIFPKVFRRCLILDIFFVPFLRILYSFATLFRENNKIHFNKIHQIARAYMVSQSITCRNVQKRAQKKATRWRRQTASRGHGPTNQLLTATNDLPSVLKRFGSHHMCSQCMPTVPRTFARQSKKC